ncbi:hypothetical protein SARC_06739 [Sphaeroforma arctica JP610]|uniref:Uncharacterized protein n=1 Tax=Sphaeroforma arctica JP610 TaxID=667725 RepID=A0A0L0FY75_9EUKA|nr:hypothetical protein SARC_06739 [Sphaeroforma arctica JP610]KNC80918.1 hypothetical protein SARC_06739 [Sphaeroforma arctica JP610]|eukprot:XP_014154820.1 hypothetical protein SARC_06739 [Sphaeroforma arctica JP610]
MVGGCFAGEANAYISRAITLEGCCTCEDSSSMRYRHRAIHARGANFHTFAHPKDSLVAVDSALTGKALGDLQGVRLLAVLKEDVPHGARFPHDDYAEFSWRGITLEETLDLGYNGVVEERQELRELAGSAVVDCLTQHLERLRCYEVPNSVDSCCDENSILVPQFIGSALVGVPGRRHS